MVTQGLCREDGHPLPVAGRFPAARGRGREVWGLSSRQRDYWTGDCWAEAHVPGLGWIGFDPAGGVCSTDRHVRVAIGLDHLGAAPVRGAHYGGGREALAVKLIVAQAAWLAAPGAARPAVRLYTLSLA